MQILGELWAVLTRAQLFDWLKVGERCSFPPFRSGREKEEAHGFERVWVCGRVVRGVLSEDMAGF